MLDDRFGHTASKYMQYRAYKTGKKKKKIPFWVFLLPLSIVAAFLAAVLIQKTLLYTVQPDCSCFSEDLSGKRLFLHKADYYKIQRGDLVHIQQNDYDTICRVTGMEGDLLRMENGILYRNGKQVEKRKLSRNSRLNSFPDSPVRPNHFFCLHDNPENGQDSRMFGAYPETALRGKVFAFGWLNGIR